jgi:hypothetical protein
MDKKFCEHHMHTIIRNTIACQSSAIMQRRTTMNIAKQWVISYCTSTLTNQYVIQKYETIIMLDGVAVRQQICIREVLRYAI